MRYSGTEEAKTNNLFSSGRWGGGSGQSCNANHRQLYQCLFLSACFAAPSICNWICSIYHLVVAQLPAHFLPGSAGPRHNWMFLFRDRCQCNTLPSCESYPVLASEFGVILTCFMRCFPVITSLHILSRKKRSWDGPKFHRSSGGNIVHRFTGIFSGIWNTSGNCIKTWYSFATF